MAYNQHHDPYYSQPQHDVAPGQVYQSHGQDHSPYVVPAGGQQNWETKSDAHSNWETKSYSSTYAGSQVHLAPNGYDAPPMPTMPYDNGPRYGGQPDYPPPNFGGYGHPGMGRQDSSGYSVAREKLMKRRSVRKVELINGNLVLDMPGERLRIHLRL